jgi:hypothetical protein
MTDQPPPLGPIDYMVVEFPGSRFNGGIAPAILDLEERGLIRVLDLLVIQKADDGSVASVELSALDADQLGSLADLDCGLAGLVTEADIEAAGDALAPGSTAGVLVWENCWARDLFGATLASGGEVIASGRIPLELVHASLAAAGELVTTGGAS